MITVSYCSNGDVTLSLRICKKLDSDLLNRNRLKFEKEVFNRVQSIEDLFSSYQEVVNND